MESEVFIHVPVTHELSYCKSWPCPPGYPSPLPHLRPNFSKGCQVLWSVPWQTGSRRHALSVHSNTLINVRWCATIARPWHSRIHSSVHVPIYTCLKSLRGRPQPHGPSASGRRRWRSDVGSGEGFGLASAVIRAVQVEISTWLLTTC